MEALEMTTDGPQRLATQLRPIFKKHGVHVVTDVSTEKGVEQLAQLLGEGT